jgi:excisionase family DNA binding protein
MSDSHGKPLDSASTPSPWMNVAGAASYARMSPSTIRRAIRRRRLAAYRLNGGSGLRLLRDDIDSWIRSIPATVKNV